MSLRSLNVTWSWATSSSTATTLATMVATSATRRGRGSLIRPRSASSGPLSCFGDLLPKRRAGLHAASLCGPRQIRLGGRLVFQRRHLVWVDPDHQVVDVIVHFREPMPRASRDHEDVASLEVIRHTVDDVGPVVPRTIELPHRLERGRTTLT